MRAVRQLRSRTVVLAVNDVDTDQIIPARFLTTTSREGLGRHLFHDWRYHNDGAEKAEFVLNAPGSRGCEILVAGRNFGCGSSREHAAWALLDHGIRAVISTEIADIFRSNSLKNGLLPVVIQAQVHEYLLRHPGETIEIDLANTTLTLADGTTAVFPLDAFARYCLMEGLDQLGFLQSRIDEIVRYEQQRPWMP